MKEEHKKIKNDAVARPFVCASGLIAQGLISLQHSIQVSSPSRHCICPANSREKVYLEFLGEEVLQSKLQNDLGKGQNYTSMSSGRLLGFGVVDIESSEISSNI